MIKGTLKAVRVDKKAYEVFINKQKSKLMSLNELILNELNNKGVNNA